MASRQWLKRGLGRWRWHSRPNVSALEGRRSGAHPVAGRELSSRSEPRDPSGKANNFSDYDSMRRDFSLAIPEHFNFAGDVLDKWAQIEEQQQQLGLSEPKPALWWVGAGGAGGGDGGEERWGFRELAERSRKAANVLTGACGLGRGDRLLLVLPRVPEWWLLNVACIRAGVVLIPGTAQLTARDVRSRLLACGARCVATDESLAPLVDLVLPECPRVSSRLLVSAGGRRDGWLSFHDEFRAASSRHECVKTDSKEVMTVFFTSGTTGSPKMTVHSHGSFGLGLTTNGRFWLDLTPADVMWNTSETGWAKSAWSSVFAPWTQGSSVFVRAMHRFDSRTVLKTLVDYPITTFCSAPTAYRMMVQEDVASFKFRSLQHCVSAGEPINPEVMEAWKRATGLDIYEGYGQTETVLVCGTFKGMKIKPGSMGKASPGYQVEVIDEQGKVVAAGEEGDLAIRIKPQRPPWLFTEYLDNPRSSAATERGDFYVTGDRATRDQDGYFWFVGRADDVILSAGYRIGPFEVESALIEHPAVVESAVTSSPDPVRGEVVKAFVVLTEEYKSRSPQLLIAELQDHVKTVTAPYKYPRKIEFVDQLPKTVSGKIRRVELRKKEWDRS
ncbi:acyl-coenzyme A synthetase ACSM3, mitochondrial-like isoform X4 [Lethenteron reissneri]|nr:acyl-coenzyme A synthetase ACSM3, mitochondrial-like isoform X4 [Lethenteron reissneri]